MNQLWLFYINHKLKDQARIEEFALMVSENTMFLKL